jgi:hypothetical protein
MVRRHVRWGAALLAVATMGCGGTSKPKPAATPPPPAESAPGGQAAGSTGAANAPGVQLSEQTAKDFDLLLNRSLPFAVEQVEKHGGTPPFGTAITKDGKFEPIRVQPPKKDQVTAREMMDLTVDALRQRAAKGELRATCLVVGGQFAPEPGKERKDVIQARLESDDGTALEFYLPWTIGADKKVKPGEGFAGQGVPLVFKK